MPERIATLHATTHGGPFRRVLRAVAMFDHPGQRGKNPAANSAVTFAGQDFQRCRRPQRQSSARRTKSARKAFRSPYGYSV